MENAFYTGHICIREKTATCVSTRVMKAYAVLCEVDESKFVDTEDKEMNVMPARLFDDASSDRYFGTFVALESMTPYQEIKPINSKQGR
jgi:hypothetical protein